MPDVLFDRERTALAELRQLIKSAGTVRTNWPLPQAAFNKPPSRRLRRPKALANEQQRKLAELDAASEQQREELVQRQAAEEEEALRTHTANLERLENAEHEARTRIGGELRDALWLAESISEGGQKRVQEHLTAVRYQMTAHEERNHHTLWKEVEPLLARFDLEREDVEPAGKLPKLAAETKPDPEGVLSRAETLLRQMQHHALLPWAAPSRQPWPSAWSLSCWGPCRRVSSCIWEYSHGFLAAKWDHGRLPRRSGESHFPVLPSTPPSPVPGTQTAGSAGPGPRPGNPSGGSDRALGRGRACRSPKQV